METKHSAQTFERHVVTFINEHQLVEPEKTLLVAVSGGQDSVCLLHLLNKLRSELRIDLHVVHLDHKLRGSESTADAQYVIDLCHKLGIPMTIEQRDVKSYQKKNNLNLEEAAREVRYNFFADVAKLVKTNRVAVAHTKDDHVETILMHLLRGSGLKGLAGLKPASTIDFRPKRLCIVRPLLETSREETGKYCRSHRLKYREDTSNQSTAFLRNRVRLELIPMLTTYNRGIKDSLVRTASLAADDIGFLETLAERLLKNVVHKDKEKLILDKPKLLELHTAMQRYVIRSAIQKLLGELKDIEARHIEEIMEMLLKPAGRQIDLPGGLQFINDYDRFTISRNNISGKQHRLIEGEYQLNIPGMTKIPGWEVQASFTSDYEEKKNNDLSVQLDYTKTGSTLLVRTRKPGDRFQPLGMQEMKKIGEFMIDNHLPRLSRKDIPIVLSESQILWVVGHRIDERVKVTEETKDILCLTFIPE